MLPNILKVQISRKCQFLILSALLAFFPYFTHFADIAAADGDEHTPNYRKNQLIIVFKKGTQRSVISNMTRNSELNAKKIDKLIPTGSSMLSGLRTGSSTNESKLERTHVVTFNNDIESLEKTIKTWENLSEIEHVQPNYIYHANAVPDDTFYSSRNFFPSHSDLYALKANQTNAEGAWITAEGEGVVVGVIDSGIDYLHPDLAANIWENPGEISGNNIDDDGNGYIDDIRGWNFDRNNADPKDEAGHGTHVAGTIAAVGNNQTGVIGVAPKATLMPVRVLGRDGSGAVSDIAAGIFYAARNGAKAINLSIGFGSRLPSDPTMENAISMAHGTGAIVVVAAGNSNDDVTHYCPANIPEVVTVAATDHENKKAAFSNYGLGVDISAPGTGILSTVPTNFTSTLTPVSVTGDGLTGLHARYLGKSKEVQEESISGNFLYAGYGEEAAYKQKDFSGKIAIVQRGRLAFTTLVANATAGNAAAIIIFNNVPGLFTSDLEYVSNIPAFSMSLEDGTKLKNLSSGSITITPGSPIKAYQAMQGTSMSAPHVTGAVALIYSAFPSDTREEILSRLYGAVDDVSAANPKYRSILGLGRLNVFKGLTASMSPKVRLHDISVSSTPDRRLKVFLAVKNHGQEASNVNVRFKSLSSQFIIEAGEVNFGAVGTLAYLKNSSVPVTIKPEGSFYPGEFIHFEAEISANGGYKTSQIVPVKTDHFQAQKLANKTGTLGWIFGDLTFVDFNNDGLPDFTENIDNNSYLYKNIGDETFNADGVITTTASPYDHIAIGTFDFDNDGNNELLISAEEGTLLYEYEKDGTFTKNLVPGTSTGRIFISDYNLDGYLDLLTSKDDGYALLKNNGGFVFSNVTENAGLSSLSTIKHTAHFFDYDSDGDDDLIVGWRLFRNNGNGTFTQSNTEANVVLPGPTDFTGRTFYAYPNVIKSGDIDNDCDLDLFIMGFMTAPTYQRRIIDFYRNNGDGTFNEETDEAGLEGIFIYLEQSADLVDYDNDGYLDLFLPTGTFSAGLKHYTVNDFLLKNHGGAFFTSERSNSGLRGVTHAGVATTAQQYADFDRDGDIDILNRDFFSGNHLHRNLIKESGTNSNSITLELKGVTSNRNAIGTRVEIETENRKLYRSVHARDVLNNPLVVGLGSDTQIKKVRIFWPGNRLQTLKSPILVNSTIEVLENICGECNEPEPTPEPTPVSPPAQTPEAVQPTPIPANPPFVRNEDILKDAFNILKNIKIGKVQSEGAKTDLLNIINSLNLAKTSPEAGPKLKKLFQTAAKNLSKILLLNEKLIESKNKQAKTALKSKVKKLKKKASITLKAATAEVKAT